MPNSNGAQTIDADPKQTVTVVDSEESGSQSQEKPGKQSITRGKRILVISAAMLSSDIRNVKFIFFIALIISVCNRGQQTRARERILAVVLRRS